jgi:hypothetical protein
MFLPDIALSPLKPNIIRELGYFAFGFAYILVFKG